MKNQSIKTKYMLALVQQKTNLPTRPADPSWDTSTSSSVWNLDSVILETCYGAQIPVTLERFDLTCNAVTLPNKP